MSDILNSEIKSLLNTFTSMSTIEQCQLMLGYRSYTDFEQMADMLNVALKIEDGNDIDITDYDNLTNSLNESVKDMDTLINFLYRFVCYLEGNKSDTIQEFWEIALDDTFEEFDVENFEILTNN
jgi:hypothetical protein